MLRPVTTLSPLVSLLAIGQLTIGLLGCNEAPIPVDQLGSRQAAIVNGTPDDDHPAVGALHSGGEQGCTATLVGGRTVITAAHCVIDRESGELLEPVHFYLGGFPYGTKLEAEAVLVHPSYDGGPSADVAIVRLAQDVDGVSPMAIAVAAPKSGELVTLLGYGLTGEDQGEFGTKRRALSVVSDLTPTTMSFFGAEGSQGNMCNGDSGGPSLAERNGQEVLVGIHSSKVGFCGNQGHDTRVDAHRQWLTNAAQGDLKLADAAASTLPDAAPYAAAGTAQTDGRFGAICLSHSDCQSGLCAFDPLNGAQFCTAHCDVADATSCPLGSVCHAGLESGICGQSEPERQASSADQGGDQAAGCSVAGSASLPPASLLLLGLLALLRVRRR